jgi:ribonuclease HI
MKDLRLQTTCDTIKNMRLTLHFDGSCWPNPGGLAKFGYTLRGSDNTVDFAKSGFAGEGPSVSNNFAEFFALAEGLEHAGEACYFHNTHQHFITVYGDSEIVIKMMQGKYKANTGKLYYPQYSRCMAALHALYRYGADVEFKWVPREKNQEADDLSKLPATTPVENTTFMQEAIAYLRLFLL